jgi:hypothetical protein
VISHALKLEYWYEFRRLKSGKYGKSLLMQTAWYSPWQQCRLCGIWGVPKKVQYRPCCYLWEKRREPIYCMGCWNKVRAIVRREEDAEFAARAARKIVTEARKWQRKVEN